MTWGIKNLPIQTESNDGLNFDLIRPLIYESKDGTIYRMDIAAQTDGASTPRVIYSLGFTPFGSYWPAALFHDGGYRDKLQTLASGDWLNGAYQKITLTKDQCDNLLLEIMLWLEVDSVKTQAIFDAVHLFGQVAFDSDRRTA